MGDFNYKEIDWDNMITRGAIGSESFKFLETLQDSYLTQCVTEDTRHRHNQISSLLDLVITNNEEIIDDIKISPPIGKSDHSIITLNLHLYQTTPISKTKKYKYYKGDYIKIAARLDDIHWETVLESKSVQESWKYLAEILTQLMDEHIPVSQVVPNINHNKFEGWITKEVMFAIKKKKKCWSKYRNVKTSENYGKFVTARNEATSKIREAKHAYEKSDK